MGEEAVYKPFFCVLRLGLWEQAQERVEDFFPISDLHWEKLYQLAMKHTVEGVLFDGLQKLPTAYLPTKALLLRWTVRVDAIERRNLWMNKVIVAQSHFFKEQKLSIMLLKGQGLARCYPNPNRRICGDIDWYVTEKKDYESLYKILQERNLKPEKQAGFSFSAVWKNCDTEVHQRMFDLHNPFLGRYLKKLEKEQQADALSLTWGDTAVALPSVLLSFVQVNAHILKHLLSFGIGMRQLCDSARLCFYYADQVDGEQLQKIYERLGIKKWIDLLHCLLVKDIGLDPKYLPFPLVDAVDAQWMMDEILTAGNFGFHDERVDLAKEEALNQRVDSFKRWRHNFARYVPYAPYETIFFPMMQFYSRLIK